MAPPPPLSPDPSFPLELGFQGLVAILLTLLLLAVRRTASPKAAKALTLGALAWLFFTGALAMQGLLTFDSFPPRIVWLSFVGLGLAATLAFSNLGRAMAHQLQYEWLIGVQTFRLPVELLLHRGRNEGLVPPSMTYFGYSFDVLTAISALLITVVHVQRPLPRWGLWTWNASGAALLLNQAILATASMPTPYRVFTEGPADTWLTYWPFVWWPTFLVPVAALAHLLLFRKLLAARRA